MEIRAGGHLTCGVVPGLCLGQQAGHRADCKVLTDMTVRPCKRQGTDSHEGSGEHQGLGLLNAPSAL